MYSAINQVMVFLSDKKENTDFVIELDSEENCINIMEEDELNILFAEQLDHSEEIDRVYKYLKDNKIEYHIREI